MVTSQDNKLIEGKLVKRKMLNHSPAIDVGDTLIGHYFHQPIVGESFTFFVKAFSLGELNMPFQTTVVKKIIDEFTFETKNSVYYLIDKSRERDIKIEDLLK